MAAVTTVEATEQVAPTPEKLNDIKQAVILVVEDKTDIRGMMVFELLSEGFSNVLEANCAADALSILKEQNPHLVLTDLRMPGELDGADLAIYVREHHPGTSVIVCSSETGASSQILEKLIAGCKPDDRIKKPLHDISVVTSTVERVLIENHLQKGS